MRPPRPIKQDQEQDTVAVAVAPPLPHNLPTPAIKQEDGVPPVAEQADRPIETFVELMDIKDLNLRLETFDAFPEIKKVNLLYMDPLLRIQGLPARDPYPENWESEIARAKDVTRRKIESSFPKNQTTTTPPAEETVNTDSDESLEEYSLYEKDVAHAMTHGSNSNNVSSTLSMAETEQLLFLENVSRCVPIMTYGFHVDKNNRETNDEFCFCPCSNTSQGTVTGRWRSLCRMDDTILPICNKNKQIKKKPFEFIAHVRGIKGCVFHQILYDFLDELYSNFYGPNKKHIGFFQINDPDYRAAIKYIKKKEAIQDKLAFEQMRKQEEENHQLHQVSAAAIFVSSIGVPSTYKNTCVCFSIIDKHGIAGCLGENVP
jgi:hypothetical protein